MHFSLPNCLKVLMSEYFPSNEYMISPRDAVKNITVPQTELQLYHLIMIFKMAQSIHHRNIEIKRYYAGIALPKNSLQFLPVEKFKIYKEMSARNVRAQTSVFLSHLINLNNLGAGQSSCTECEVRLPRDQYGEVFSYFQPPSFKMGANVQHCLKN